MRNRNNGQSVGFRSVVDGEWEPIQKDSTGSGFRGRIAVGSIQDPVNRG